jgi:hypothetical protein
MAPAGTPKVSMASAPAQTPTKPAKRASDRQVHLEQLRNVELLNGRAAMLGIVIGVVVEGLTGFGILHQIGLGALVDGYSACRTQYLPFCF